MNKVIITAAISGAETTRDQQPNLPYTPDEMAIAAKEAREAGVSVIHLHARNDDGTPSADPGRFRECLAAIRGATDVVVEFTTGGAIGMSDDERLAPLAVKPEMASLDCGSVNFADEILPNSLPSMRRFATVMRELGVKPTFECFDVGHVYNANILIKEGLVKPPFHFTFVLGVPGGMPATMEALMMMKAALPDADLEWTGIGVGGRGSVLIPPVSALMGGHARIGFEDNIYYTRGVVAQSNAQLARRIADMVRAYGGQIATPDDVRERFGLKKN
ncbi:3-keto-5-aminohexanoate cleavage protein [Myxococcota bacterium]|nr:3-keto-5-aminohexanoate cleavage protein [Myxococcota bacterium]MBU1538025.1 3-keto-5-aminohexanoate cleavage protein [Myxococcota bacterium]